MCARNIVVIAVDGLRAASLGAYGNTWFETPWFDRLAAASLLEEWHFTDSLQLPLLYRSLWRSVHAMRPEGVPPRGSFLAADLGRAGYRTMLLTDDAQVARLGEQHGIEQVHARPSKPATLAGRIAETSHAQLFEQACALWTELDADRASPSLLWIHSRGGYGPWDAPLGLRASLCEEGDPEPSKTLAPPELVLDRNSNGDYDSDVAFAYACAYAAQIQVLDACLGALMEHIGIASAEGSGHPADKAPILALVGVRGFPLGMHGRIGGVDPRLTAEQVHTPLFLSMAGQANGPVRNNRLSQPVDFAPTLLCAAGVRPQGEVDGCDLLAGGGGDDSEDPGWAISTSPSFRTFRTVDWCLRLSRPSGSSRLSEDAAERGHVPSESTTTTDPGDAVEDAENDSGEQLQLFVRPDDYWEVNDVATMCPEAVSQLKETLAAFEPQALTGAALQGPECQAGGVP